MLKRAPPVAIRFKPPRLSVRTAYPPNYGSSKTTDCLGPMSSPLLFVRNCLKPSDYWNAVSEKLLSLRECSRSIGISASFSIALMPMVRCCATCRL